MSRLFILFAMTFLCSMGMGAHPEQAVYVVKITSASEKILAYEGLNGMEAADKAAFYNLLVDSALSKKGGGDMVLALKSAILCDQYDLVASEGQAGRLRFHARNAARMSSVCPKVIDVGLEAYGRKDYLRAIDCFTLYLERYNTSLFVNRSPEKDPYVNQCAFFAVQSAFKAGRNDVAQRYMDRALRSSEYAEDATVIQVSMMGKSRSNWQDSLRYVTALNEAHQKCPKNNALFGMLVTHYSLPANASSFKRFMEGEVMLDKNSREKWAMLGELEMRDKKWDKAVEAYKKALLLDTAFVEVVYNMGVSYYNMGNQKDAIECFEKCRRMDAERKKVGWAHPLYAIYKELGDEEKARELLPFVK